MKANTVIFSCALVTFLVVGLACGIVWLLIGTDHHDDDCFQDESTPNIATWLIVEGATLVGMAALVILFTPCFFIQKVKQNTPGGHHLLLLLYFVLLAYMLFHLAWLIVGAVRLSESDCASHSTIYQTTLAAVILGFVFFIFPLCMFPGKPRND